MSAVCELTGKGVQFGHNVSHSQIKIKRKFLPNLQNIAFFSNILNISLSFRVSTNAIKSVDKKNGIDHFLLSAKKEKLSQSALRVKKVLQKKSNITHENLQKI